MKHKLLYLLPFLLILGSGCLKTTATPQPTVPSGTFTGEFRYLHRHLDTKPFDTLKANIVVKLLTTNFTFTVTGDTSMVHAGSYGNFALASPYIIFTDKTYSSAVTPTKSHLNGAYTYYYDGTTFQMLSYSSDTLALQYDLKKTSN